jgi:hypothetical protein
MEIAAATVSKWFDLRIRGNALGDYNRWGTSPTSRLFL